MSQPNYTEKELYDLARFLHEARMKLCYGNYYPSYRFVFPAYPDGFHELLHNESHPQADMAMAQAKALLKLGFKLPEGV